MLLFLHASSHPHCIRHVHIVSILILIESDLDAGLRGLVVGAQIGTLIGRGFIAYALLRLR